MEKIANIFKKIATIIANTQTISFHKQYFSTSSKAIFFPRQYFSTSNIFSTSKTFFKTIFFPQQYFSTSFSFLSNFPQGKTCGKIGLERVLLLEKYSFGKCFACGKNIGWEKYCCEKISLWKICGKILPIKKYSCGKNISFGKSYACG